MDGNPHCVVMFFHGPPEEEQRVVDLLEALAEAEHIHGMRIARIEPEQDGDTIRGLSLHMRGRRARRLAVGRGRTRVRRQG